MVDNQFFVEKPGFQESKYCNYKYNIFRFSINYKFNYRFWYNFVSYKYDYNFMKIPTKIWTRSVYIDKLRPFIGKNLIKVFTGQRRVGKSYQNPM